MVEFHMCATYIKEYQVILFAKTDLKSNAMFLVELIEWFQT